VKYELSFDQHHEYKERIYRIQRYPFCSLAPSFVPLLEQDFPEMEHIVRFTSAGQLAMKVEDKVFIEENVFFAEHDVFEVFSLNLIKGNPITALEKPNLIVLTESVAKKYFGNDDPVNQNILINNEDLATVSGVIKDLPENTHFHFDMLISYETLRKYDEAYFLGEKNFSDNVCPTYTRLAVGSDPREIENRFGQFLDKHIAPHTDDEGKTRLASEDIALNLTKVTDIHLKSHTRNELGANGDIKYVRIFSLTAVFILLIACINFINLSTAQGIKRLKEIAIRKVIGSGRKNIIIQFVAESLPLVLLALLFAVVMSETIFPFYKNFIGIPENFNIGVKESFVFIISVFVFTSLAAILYPALNISGFKTFTRLKEGSSSLAQAASKKERSALRRLLVIFQFCMSIIIIICLIIIFNQMQYMKNKDLGFNKENVIILPANPMVLEKWDEFKQELLKNSDITNVTYSKRGPSGRLLDNPGFQIEVNGKTEKSSIYMPHNRVEHDFFKTYGIKIIAGRDFDKNIPTDTSEAAILNETAVKQLGFESPEQAIGAPVRFTFDQDKEGKVIGVVKDFHYESLHRKIPAIITYLSSWGNTIAIRVVPGNIKERIKTIEKIWEMIHHGYPLNYSFLDERINLLYKNEEKMMAVFRYFGILAILIACLGLFGLALYSTERRTKEIGIRKANGAKTAEISLMLSKDFTRWVVIAFAISCPIAYYFMNKWLQNFAYRANLSWWIFLAAGAVALAVALITVSWQSWRAASRNPVEALRYE
jgi:putative ABC transport system permease protein